MKKINFSRRITPIVFLAVILSAFLGVACDREANPPLKEPAYASSRPILTPQTAPLDGFLHGVFDPTGRRVVTTGYWATATIWDVETGDILRSITGTTGQFQSVAFSPDGHFILVTNPNTNAQIWDAETGKLMREIVDSRRARACAFSPDGLCVALGYDVEIKLFNAKTGNLITAFAIPGGDLWRKMVGDPYDFGGSVRFSPDSKWLLEVLVDGVVRLWDVHTGRVVRMIKGARKKFGVPPFRRTGAKSLLAAQTRRSASGMFRLEHD